MTAAVLFFYVFFFEKDSHLNAVEIPLFPRDLLFSTDFKLLNTSSSDMIPEQLNVCSFASLTKGSYSKYVSILSLIPNFTRKQRLIKRKYLLIYFILISVFILVDNNRIYLNLDCTIFFQV